MSDRPTFALIVGSGRSGTTLVRNILDAHPVLAVAHEAHFVSPAIRRRRRYERREGFDRSRFVSDLFANPNFRRQGLGNQEVTAALLDANPSTVPDAVRAVMGLYASTHGKSRFGDKTPGYVTHLAELAAALPEARFLHVVRDGRDVALAYLDRPEWGPATLTEAALYWRQRVGRGRRAGERLGPQRYLEIRYEDLVADPEEITSRVCDFFGIDYRPKMLEYHRKGSDFIATTATPSAFGGLARPITAGMRDWRKEMSPADVATFEAIAGTTLAGMGYELRAAPDARARRRALAGAAAWQVKRVRSRLPRTSS